MRRIPTTQKCDLTAVSLRHFFGCGVGGGGVTFLLFFFFAFGFSYGQNGVRINSAATSPSQQNPVPLTFSFDQPLSGFIQDDVGVSGGEIGDLEARWPDFSFLNGTRMRDFVLNIDVIEPEKTNFEPSKDAVIAIAIDNNGNTYALTLNNGVFKYNTNNQTVSGNPIIKPGALNEARDIAIGSDQNIYIANTGNNEILVFNNTGGVTTKTIGSSGLSSPTGLTFNANNILYVADTGNDRIVIYNQFGGQIGEINPGGGAGAEQMNDPIRVAVDNNDVVYVSDIGNNRIQIYNPDGSHKGTINGGTSRLNSPGSIVVDEYGFLYVADFAGVDLNVFLDFGNITAEDIFNLATNLQDLRIQVFKTRNISEAPTTIKNGINIPIDLAFKPCGFLAVNNGDAKTEGTKIVEWRLVLPVNFLFDLKLYNRLPHTFTAELTIDEECEAATVSIPAGVGENKDCQSVPQNKSSVFSMVWDETAPIIESCSEEPVYTVESGFTIPNYFEIYQFKASDNCGGGLTFRQTPPSTTVITEDTTVKIVAFDEAGNESEACTIQLIIVEEDPPSFECATPPATLDLDENCDTPERDFGYLITNRQNFQNGIYTEQREVRNGNILNVNLKVYHGTDASGDLVGECDFNISLLDKLDPLIGSCDSSPVNLDLDSGNDFTIPDYSNRITFSDNCDDAPVVKQIPEAGVVVNQNTTVTLTVQDDSGNISNVCSFSINFRQTSNEISCHTTDLLLGPDGTAVLDPELIFDGDPNDPAIRRLEVEPSNFDCDDLGIRSLNLIAYYNDGTTAECSTQIEVKDDLPPVINCPAGEVNQSFDPEVGYEVPDYAALFGVADNCNFEITQLPAPGTVIFESRQIDLIAEDSEENRTSCYFILRLTEATEYEITFCPGSRTEELTQNCEFELPNYISQVETTVEPHNITQVPPAGTNISEETEVIITVTWPSGETDTCEFTVNVQDTEDPVMDCPDDITERLAPGETTKVVHFSTLPATDNCYASVEQTEGLASGSEFPTGVHTIEFTATDISGNESSCYFTITIEESSTTPGTCKPAFVYLDASGNGTLQPEDIFDGDPDDTAIVNMEVDRENFTCEDMEEPVEVNLNVEYADGTTTTCTALVTVKDDIAPEIVCVEEFTVNLNEFGEGRITPEIIDRGSSDNCGISMSLSRETFGNDDVGEQEVTLTVRDASGNESTCITKVTVVAYDEESPGLSCVEDLEVSLDGDGSYSLQLRYSGDEENEDYEASKDTFTCDDIGTQTITITYWGEHTGTCEIDVTVVDKTPPVITCLPELELRLNAAGSAVLSTADLDLEYSDNCGVADTSLSRETFSTADVGINEVIFTVTDGSGNISTCTTTVNVLPFEDEEPDPIQCVDLLVIQIGEDGRAVLDPRDLFSGGTGSAQYSVTKDTFSCFEIGEHTVTLEYSTPTEEGSCDIRIVVEDPENNCGEPVDPEIGDYIILYPNPGDGNVKFQRSPGLEIHRVEVFDMRGRFLMERIYETPSIFDTRLDISEYQSGVYTLLIHTNKKEFIKRAIIRN